MSGVSIALSNTSIAILKMIAGGSSYEQILAAHPEFTYFDIFNAASEAIEACTETRDEPASTVEKIRELHSRAYEKWTDDEDEQLRRAIEAGMTIARISGRFQRQRSAIRSRIRKLELVDQLPPKERMRLERFEAKHRRS